MLAGTQFGQAGQKTEGNSWRKGSRGRFKSRQVQQVHSGELHNSKKYFTCSRVINAVAAALWAIGSQSV